MSAMYALRSPVMRATLVSASPVVVRREVPAVRPQPEDPGRVPEHEGPDDSEAYGPAHMRPPARRRLGSGSRDRHLAHDAHESREV